MTKASRFKRNRNEPGMSHMVSSLKESSKRDFIHNSFTKKEGTQSNIQRTNGLFSYPPLEILGNNMAASTSTETSTSTTDYMYALDGDVETEEPYGQNYSDVNTAKNFNRDKWPRRMEFLLMLVGYTVGLGNVWRFPYLCHKNGGATFLIPYAIFLVAEGIPLYYMELTLGQRLRQGSLGVWHMVSPYLDGLGIASVCVCILVCIYYNVILAWCLVYFVNSFKSPLPWSTCPKEKVMEGNTTVMKEIEECRVAGASKYFWYRTTLNISQGIEHGSQINWTLALTLLITWIIVWLFMIRGIRTEGKVVYVTSTLPILLLAVMFFRGVHLPGFQEGLALLFIPDFARLKDPLVWLDAASHTFFSLGIAYGSLIAFASYNPLKNDTTRDAIIVCLIDTGVSVYASVVMFCFIGYRAHKKMINCLEKGGKIASTDHQLYNMISEGMTTTVYPTGNTTALNTTQVLCNKNHFLGELSQSTGLAFITFTEAIDTLPFPNMWSVFFYLMLFLLGIDTQCGMLQGLLTPLLDSKLYPKLRIEVITGCMCLSIFVASLTMTLQSGHYWFQIISNYSASIPLLIIALVQCIALSYIYGMEKFLNDIEYMTNRRPRQIWIICWKFVSPIMIVVVLVFSVYSLAITPPTYQVWDSKSGKVKSMALPPWAIFIGVMIMFISVLFIPSVAILRHFKLIENGQAKFKFLVRRRQREARHYEKYTMTPIIHHDDNTL